MYSVSFIPTNSQVKKFLPPSSIGGFPHKGANGKVEFRYFLDEFGEESDLVIPSGGELMLDPDNPIDKHNIATFQLFRTSFPGVASQFVVNDLTVDKQQKRDLRKSKALALALVSEIVSSESFETLVALARRLGNRKFNIERSEVVDYLEEIADGDPNFLIKALEDPEREMRLLVEKAIDRMILSREKNGMIKYGPLEGGQPIGKDENEALVYLKHNTGLLEQIMSEVENRPLPMSVVRAKPGVVEEIENISPAELLAEVNAWIGSKVLTTTEDDKGKVKSISYSSMELGKTPEKVVDFLLKNKHFVKIFRQRASN